MLALVKSVNANVTRDKAMIGRIYPAIKNKKKKEK